MFNTVWLLMFLVSTDAAPNAPQAGKWLFATAPVFTTHAECIQETATRRKMMATIMDVSPESIKLKCTAWVPKEEK